MMLPGLECLVSRGRKLRDALENEHERTAMELAALAACGVVAELAPPGTRIAKMATAAMVAGGYGPVPPGLGLVMARLH